MGKKEKKRHRNQIRWDKLDNTAHLFPVIAGESMTNVYRISVTLKEEIQPELVTFHTDVKTPAGRAFLANAITLTPGTITVSLEGDTYVVHCLDESMAAGLADAKLEQMLHELEG